MVNLKAAEEEEEEGGGEYEDDDGAGDDGVESLMHGNEGDDATDIFLFLWVRDWRLLQQIDAVRV